MIKKLEETGSLTIRAGRRRKPVCEDVITDEATAIGEVSQGTIAGTSSARGVARQLGMNYSTVCRVLRRVIGFYPYKIRRLPELKPSDYDKRVTFPLSFLARVEIDDAFPWHILWEDECHFYLIGSVNSQNRRIWASEQPHTVHEIH
ncbi:uncharacterized protein LOC118198705 [Stegodyphus dumicola]|uniref:uncharacterized protein LOC118198705 n=1 Tax=Stegodyphus dumicola TaxID=202533 RepID=UPI0015AC7117|nr:uncharacterized protein LOC118198705 [Stegodyphus dumicola]